MRILRKIYWMIFRIVKKLLFLLELFLFLRLVLKFLNANPLTPIVRFIYKYSDILISPFEFIFSNIYWRGKLIETATISAMVGYLILVLIFFQLLRLFSRE